MRLSGAWRFFCMYRLLLVSDRPKVLDTFERFDRYERLGFKPPHIRNDYDGMLDSFQKHHADGIAFALPPEEEKKVLQFLKAQYPILPIFEACMDADELCRSLNELGNLLMRMHGDYSNDKIGRLDMLMYCRHEFFRKLIAGGVANPEILRRSLRLLRSQMRSDQPCVLVSLSEVEDSGSADTCWDFERDELERLLRKCFGRELNGMRVLPLVPQERMISMLVCPMEGVEDVLPADAMTKLVKEHVAKVIESLYEYEHLKLRADKTETFPNLAALCSRK